MRCTARAAHGARLAEAAVDGHAVAEGGHLFREAVAGLAAQALGPVVQRLRASRRTAVAISAWSSSLRQRQRRQAGGVQDLVGVGVADAVEQLRIGEGALERVILARQRGARTRRGRRSSTSRPPGSCCGERRLAAHEVQRRALLRAGLGKRQRAVGKAKRGQADLAGQLGAGRLPVQPARDHQVQDQEEARRRSTRRCACRAAAARAPCWPSNSRERRIDACASRNGLASCDLLQRLADNARAQAFEVDGDVGQLGHGASKWVNNPASPRREPRASRTGGRLALGSRRGLAAFFQSSCWRV